MPKQIQYSQILLHLYFHDSESCNSQSPKRVSGPKYIIMRSNHQDKNNQITPPPPNSEIEVDMSHDLAKFGLETI